MIVICVVACAFFMTVTASLQCSPASVPVGRRVDVRCLGFIYGGIKSIVIHGSGINVSFIVPDDLGKRYDSKTGVVSAVISNVQKSHLDYMALDMTIKFAKESNFSYGYVNVTALPNSTTSISTHAEIVLFYPLSCAVKWRCGDIGEMQCVLDVKPGEFESIEVRWGISRESRVHSAAMRMIHHLNISHVVSDTYPIRVIGTETGFVYSAIIPIMDTTYKCELSSLTHTRTDNESGLSHEIIHLYAASDGLRTIEDVGCTFTVIRTQPHWGSITIACVCSLTLCYVICLVHERCRVLRRRGRRF